MKKKIDNFFGISKRKSSFKIETFAGIATFLAMAYILVVNPNNILWGGTNDARFASVFIATAIGACIGSLLMALWAKMPLAQAPGMGINAVAGSIIGGAMGFSFSYGNVMAMIFVSGLIFLLLSVIPCGKDKKTGKKVSFREKIFDGIPSSIRQSISVGIGLFIAFIGLKNANIITSDQFTLVSLLDFNNPLMWEYGAEAWYAVVTLFGLIVITLLSFYKVKGAILLGILSATILAIPLGVADINILLGNTPGITWKFWENFNNFIVPNGSYNQVFFSLVGGGFSLPSGSISTFIMVVITFAMLDMFDTMGSVLGCCQSANLVDEDGKPYNYKEIMYADSAATIVGSLVGTSTVTTFVESSTGVSLGGRTGFTALVTSILFALSIFFLPLFAFIPSAAAASALIYVGVIMISNVTNIDFSNVKYSVPAFMTIIIMVLSYSITNGIGFGIITFVMIDVIVYFISFIRYKIDNKNEKPKLDSNIITFIVFFLFLLYFLIPVGI